MNQFSRHVQQHPLWYVVNGAALLPLLGLELASLFGQLGNNPVRTILIVTGDSALILLLASLVCTPLNTLFGLRQAMTVRKSLGMQAFMYAGLHLLAFVGGKYGFQFSQFLRKGVLLQPDILVGLLAFLILLPLALTSAKIWQRWLGKKWKQLHRWVYLAAGLAVLHTVLLITDCAIQPLTYAKILVLLLAVRIPALRSALVNLRHMLSSALFENRRLAGAQPINSHPVGLGNWRLKPIGVVVQSIELQLRILRET